MWNRKRSKRPDYLALTPEKYPAGTCVKTIDGNAYLIGKDGKKYRIISNRILDSWSFPRIVITTENALRDHPTAVSKLGFREGTLLNNIADGKLYLVSGSKACRVISPDVLVRLGVTPADALLVSDAEMKTMKIGEDIY